MRARRARARKVSVLWLVFRSTFSAIFVCLPNAKTARFLARNGQTHSWRFWLLSNLKTPTMRYHATPGRELAKLACFGYRQPRAFIAIFVASSDHRLKGPMRAPGGRELEKCAFFGLYPGAHFLRYFSFPHVKTSKMPCEHPKSASYSKAFARFLACTRGYLLAFQA